jgi:amino acid transporter
LSVGWRSITADGSQIVDNVQGGGKPEFMKNLDSIRNKTDADANQHSSSPSLRSGALGLSGVLMQGITHQAPATAILFTLQFVCSYAGVTAPLAYLMAFLIVAILGVSVTQLAKHLPSAGGYYTYVSRTVHPRAGFFTSWLSFLYEPTTAGFSLAFVGSVLEQALRAEYQLVFPWWLFLLITGLFVAWVAYRGIELSARLMLLFGIAEVAIVLLLSIWGLFNPGDGGINLSSFNPGNARSPNGLYLGVVFSIFALTGWEGVAPLAEESRDPRRTLPRAIMIAIFLMGAFLVFCSWGLLIGWGSNRLGELVGSAQNPTFVLAKRFWGGGWILVLLALLNSMIAVAIAANNSATRIWFAMARSGALPSSLARVHPRYQTPTNAVTLQMLVMLGVGWGLGMWVGPDKEFELMGNVITFALIFIYSAGNLGVFRFYWMERHREFNWILHALFPLIGTAALIFVGYNSLVPWPAPPVAFAPWIVGIWLVLGLLVLVYMKIANKEDWMASAGKVLAEDGEHSERRE